MTAQSHRARLLTDIEEIIRDDVKADIHGDLYGVDRAAEAIAALRGDLHNDLLAALSRIRDEYGLNHTSKFARDLAVDAIAKATGEAGT